MVQTRAMLGHELVFVYGTLRRSFHNHEILDSASYLGAGRTVDHFAMYVDDLPYVVRGEARYPVLGELYRVSPPMLMVLDALEGHPSHYRREKIRVRLDSGGEFEAWFYFYPRPRGRLLPSGDYAGEGGL